MFWQATELEAPSPRGTYLVYRAGDVWIARFRPLAGRDGGRGVPIEPGDGEWGCPETAQAACAVHFGRMERGDSPVQASEWIRRHADYLTAGVLEVRP